MRVKRKYINLIFQYCEYYSKTSIENNLMMAAATSPTVNQGCYHSYRYVQDILVDLGLDSFNNLSRITNKISALESRDLSMTMMLILPLMIMRPPVILSPKAK